MCRLAEKKATIGYTYEDSTVAEPDPQSDKDEDNSENSESEEDEGIPDIGEEIRFTHQKRFSVNHHHKEKLGCQPTSETGC